MSDEYAHDVGRKLCLQLCSLAGYGAASDHALDVLADLMNRFLKETTIRARSYAETAGRTELNVLDFVGPQRFSFLQSTAKGGEFG